MTATPQETARPRDLLLAGALGIGLVWLLVALSLPLRYSYQNDSSGYVDEARMLLQGEGIRRAAPWQELEHEYIASPLFPPGFAVQTTLVALAGPEPAQAARALSWLAWALLLPAIVFTASPLIGRGFALATGMLVVTSPGLYEWGYPAMSDSSALLYSILSLGILIHARQRAPAGAFPVLLSGLFAGVAFAVRNAALVVPLAVAGTLALLWLLRRQSFMAAFREGLWWGLGFLLVAGLVFGRNWLVFGAVQPYLEHHGGGEYGLLRAFRVTLWSQLQDLSASRSVADLAWDARALLLTLPPLLVLLAVLGWRKRHRLAPAGTTAILLLALYSAIGFAMVVWGRSRFDWVEVNLNRHMMAYSWSLLVLMLWPLREARLGLSSTPARAGMMAVLLLVLVSTMAIRADYIRQDLQQEARIRQAGQQTENWAGVAGQFPDAILTNFIKYRLSRDVMLHDYLVSRVDNPYLLSNFAAVLRLETGLPARNFDMALEHLAELATVSARLGDRPVLLVVAPSNSMLRPPMQANWQETILDAMNYPHKVELRSSNLLVVEIP